MSKGIQNITLNNVASYKEPTEIKDLKKLNFFFGSNGTGKSTIGKYLQALKEAEDKQNIKEFEQCTITGYKPEEHEILVFNQQFIDDNFIKNNDIPGIFTLDERNKDIEEEIEKEQNKINKWNECLEKLDVEKRKNEDLKKEIYSGANGVLNKVWNLRNDFNKNFKKMPTLEHPKSRENHYNKIHSIQKSKEEQDIDYEDLKRDYHKLYEKEISKIEQAFNWRLYLKIRRLERQINTKLIIPFTGNKEVDIANMIETLGIRKWVEERWNQIDKTTLPQKCPFCQEETINQNLVKQFEDYFDKTYTEKKQVIEKLKIQYGNLTKDFIFHLNSIKSNYPEKSDLNQLINKLEKFFDKQKRVIQDKIDNTNKELSIASVNTHIKELKTVLSTIASNNEDFEKLDEKRQELIQKIWKYMAFHAKSPIDEYKNEKKKLDKKLRQIKDIIAHKKIQIAKSELIVDEKRKKTANTDTAKDEINEILKNTGFHGFIIDKKETTENNISRYYLKRPDDDEKKADVFGTLSEGEKNFVAFLYFYWLCKGTDDQDKKKGKKKIIVIDDPVSSLDSQALFVVTTVIRELMKKEGNSKPQKRELLNKNINQIFVLSHNLYFYNEVSYNKGFQTICQNIHHYQISKPSNKSLISEGSAENKIENDYNLMWRGLFELKDQKGNFNIVIGNLMRRIIHSYLQFTQNDHKERKSFEELKDNTKKMLYNAFASQINKESHHVNPMEELSFQRIAGFNGLDSSILFEVFEMFLKDIGAENHYIAMLKYINDLK